MIKNENMNIYTDSLDDFFDNIEELVPTSLENSIDIKNPIEEWIEENCEITGFYRMTKDGIDVIGSITIKVVEKNIEQFPIYIQFNHVSRHFILEYPSFEFGTKLSPLKSLRGCPKSVGGLFLCSYSSIESLEGCPDYIRDSFICDGCYLLKSLENGPNYVGGAYFCSNCNSIKNLKGMPNDLTDSFICSNNISLESLEGAPEHVYSFTCSNNPKLESLEGMPSLIDSYCHILENGRLFTINDIKKLSKVEKIYTDER